MLCWLKIPLFHIIQRFLSKQKWWALYFPILKLFENSTLFNHKFSNHVNDVQDKSGLTQYNEMNKKLMRAVPKKVKQRSNVNFCKTFMASKPIKPTLWNLVVLKEHKNVVILVYVAFLSLFTCSNPLKSGRNIFSKKLID